MATLPQESARAVRAGLARPAAAARPPRADETAAAFPGLLAVSLAQAPAPNLPGQGEVARATAAATVTGWPFAAAPGAAAPSPAATTATTPPPPPAPPGTFIATAATVAPAAAAPATAATPAAASAGVPVNALASAAATEPAVVQGTYASAAMALSEAAAPESAPPTAGAQTSTTPTATQHATATPTAPPPTAGAPRQSLAQAWLAANVALAAAVAPTGEAAAFPATGGLDAADPNGDASGAAVRPGAGQGAPASVSRQVTIQLLKLSGDAAAPAGRLTLRLDPPQLGRVEVSFEQRGGTLLVTLTAQTPEAERALRNGAGELQQALAGAGGRWQDAQVKVEPATGRDEPRPDGGEESGDQGEQPSGQRRRREDG